MRGRNLAAACNCASGGWGGGWGELPLTGEHVQAAATKSQLASVDAQKRSEKKKKKKSYPLVMLSSARGFFSHLSPTIKETQNG